MCIITKHDRVSAICVYIQHGGKNVSTYISDHLANTYIIDKTYREVR